ncbi:MAG: hypothetical protein KDC10_03740 [Calditrichaeota bacterium]|nr:hypothetical protein [Calditrichota bacterium]
MPESINKAAESLSGLEYGMQPLAGIATELRELSMDGLNLSELLALPDPEESLEPEGNHPWVQRITSWIATQVQQDSEAMRKPSRILLVLPPFCNHPQNPGH